MALGLSLNTGVRLMSPTASLRGLYPLPPLLQGVGMSQGIESASCPHCATGLVPLDGKAWCQHCDKFRGPDCQDEGCPECFPADEQ